MIYEHVDVPINNYYEHDICTEFSDEIVKYNEYYVSINKLKEIYPLIKFAEKFKNKVILDIPSLIEAIVPEKYKVCEYIAKYLTKYMELKELLNVKIYGDIDDSRIYHYIKIVPVFKSSYESLDISEELDMNIYASPLSNRILVFPMFE